VSVPVVATMPPSTQLPALGQDRASAEVAPGTVVAVDQVPFCSATTKTEAALVGPLALP